MVHEVLKAAPGISPILSGIYLKENTPTGFYADKGNRNGNKLAKRHFCRSNTCCGSCQGLVLAAFFPVLICSFVCVLFCFIYFFQRPLRCLLNPLFLLIIPNCFFLALVDHIRSEEHLEGVKSVQLQRETSCWANAVP